MNRWWLLCGLVVATAWGADEPGDQGVTVPRAVGLAALAGDRVAARERAMIDAKRNAVEAVLGVMVKSETKVEMLELVSDQVDVSSEAGFVYVDETLQDEPTPDGQAYVVALRCRVSTRPLVGAVADQFLKVYEALEKPRLAVVLDERDAGGQPATTITTGLIGALLKRGFDVVDKPQLDKLIAADQAAAAADGDEAAVRYLAEQVKANLNVELLLIGQAATAAGGSTASLRTLNTFDARYQVSVNGAGSSPADLLAKLLPGPQSADDLVSLLVSDWMTKPTILTVVLSRATLTQLKAIESALSAASQVKRIDLKQPAVSSQVPVIAAATRRSFNPAVSQLEVRSPFRRSVAIEALSELLEQRGFEVTGIVGGRINAKAKAK